MLLSFIQLGIILVLFWAGHDAVRTEMTFWQIFARFEIILIGYKLVDMFILDIVVIEKLRIFDKLFPETKGCKSIQRFDYSLKKQTIKLFVFTEIALVVAAILRAV